jgi:FKBP-type peptidyl-prolyl cis-trans isomerase
MAISQQLAPFQLTADELAFIQMGIADSVNGAEPKVDIQAYLPMIQSMAQERMGRAAEAEKQAATEFLAGKAAEDGATRTASGLIIKELVAGTGASPSADDTVEVHYHGTLRDGSVFDSSVDRGTPATFPLNGVIACWTEGLQLMKVGGKSQLTCPSDLAYGDRGRPGIPPGAPLVFDVELLSIQPASP